MAMVILMISMARPVWLSAVPVNTETRSGYAMAAAREEFLMMLRYWLLKGGRATRKAWGSMIRRMICFSLSARLSAASRCPLATDSMPARMYSAM